MKYHYFRTGHARSICSLSNATVRWGLYQELRRTFTVYLQKRYYCWYCVPIADMLARRVISVIHGAYTCQCLQHCAVGSLTNGRTNMDVGQKQYKQ